MPEREVNPRVPGGGPTDLTAAFEAEGRRLLRMAYSMLGSLSEAEDIVQEAWLRLQRTEPAEIRDLAAWLTTVVSRLALDALGTARARRESYVGPWLPEPLVTRAEPVAAAAPDDAVDPADRVTLDESVSLALLIVLERLSPAERVAFLLHDVFGHSFAEVAAAMGRSAPAVRQLAARARRDVEAHSPREPPSREEHLALTWAFATACTEGDLDGLIRLLDPDVVWTSDGGGKANAALVAHRGAAKVSRAMLALSRKLIVEGYLADVNGHPGLVTISSNDGGLSVTYLTVDAGQVVAIDVIRNPDKLTRVPLD